MTKRKKLKPDFRRIRPTLSYSVAELAKAIGPEPATVRRWHREGMPALDDQKPMIFDGDAAKKWLKQKWAKKQTVCGPDEAHCLRCCVPKPFAKGTRSLKNQTGRVLIMSGQCAVCGARMNKFVSSASVEIFEPVDKRGRGSCAA